MGIKALRQPVLADSHGFAHMKSSGLHGSRAKKRASREVQTLPTFTQGRVIWPINNIAVLLKPTQDTH